MTGTLAALLLRLSEAGPPALLWGRQPAPHHGRTFDRLLARGVLIEQAPATEWDLCPACDCGLEARPIQKIDGRHVAACPLDRGGDVVLDAEDLRSFRIEPSALVREIAAASGFGDAPSEVAPGLWHLGVSATRTVFLILSQATLVQPGLIAVLRSVERSAPIALIAPSLPASEQTRFAEAGMSLATLGACIGDDFAIDRAGLEAKPVFAPRLAIRRSSRSVVLDGVSYALSDQTFQLLALLAERASSADPHASPRDIEERIWGEGVYRLSRQARDVVRELRDALAASASDAEAVRRLIENRRNRGWRLMLAAAEIDLGA